MFPTTMQLLTLSDMQQEMDWEINCSTAKTDQKAMVVYCCFVPHRCITATLQVRAYLATICPIKPCHTRFAHSLGCIALHSINNPLGPKDLIQLNIMSLAKRSRAIQERVVASNKPLPLCALLKHLCHAQGQNT